MVYAVFTGRCDGKTVGFHGFARTPGSAGRAFKLISGSTALSEHAGEIQLAESLIFGMKRLGVLITASKFRTKAFHRVYQPTIACTQHLRGQTLRGEFQSYGCSGVMERHTFKRTNLGETRR